MDQRRAAESAEENEAVSRATFEAVQRLNTLPIPTVALVQGGCFGGGTGVIAACDVVIAADNALFSITEVRWGLTAAIIIPQLCDAIGVRQVRRYALTGERFGAEEARRIGLVHEVVPLAELEARARRWSSSCSPTARQAMAETKALALESSFGGMGVDDEAYARLVRMHSDAPAGTGGGVGGTGVVRGEARGEVGQRIVVGATGYETVVANVEEFAIGKNRSMRFAVETYRHRRAGRDRQNPGAQAGAGAAGACARGNRDKGSGEGAGLARPRRHRMPAGLAR